MDIPGLTADGLPLLMPAVYCDPTSAQTPALGTMHCQGPYDYKAATLAPVWWKLTLNSPPAHYADYPSYVESIVCGTPDSQYRTVPWHPNRPAPASYIGSGGWGHIGQWTVSEDPLHIQYIRTAIYSLTVRSLVSSEPTDSKRDGTTELTCTLRLFALDITNDAGDPIGGGAAGVMWQTILDTPWPDVMILDALELPFFAQRDGIGGTTEAGGVSWSGTTVTIERQPKPGDPFYPWTYPF